MTRAVAVSASLRAAVAAPLLAALACGGGGSALGVDGAAPVEAGGETGGTVPTSCDLPTQVGCTMDQQCSVFCDSQPQIVIACRPEPIGAPGIGQPCMNLPCTRGSVCMAVAGMGATCKQLCAATADCPAGQGCRDVTTTYGCATTGPTSIRIKACL
jgi:hypothetical protein